MPAPSSVRPLAPSVSVYEIADECRDAAVAFLNGAHTGWGKSDLVAWLLGPYARATAYLRRSESNVPPPVEEREVCAATLERVMFDARCEVIATSTSLALAKDGVSFAHSAISTALVARCRDELGDLGWAPFPPRRQRLADRLLALIAVDYLARPLDYEDAFAVCTTCGVVAFDSAARGRGLCREHSVSGIRLKQHDTLSFEVDPRRTAP